MVLVPRLSCHIVILRKELNEEQESKEVAKHLTNLEKREREREREREKRKKQHRMKPESVESIWSTSGRS